MTEMLFWAITRDMDDLALRRCENLSLIKTKRMRPIIFCWIGVCLLISCEQQPPYVISGDLMQWHKVTLTFDGPSLSESSTDNPFADYRLYVTFKQGTKTYTVPGYFAADGQAGETSATAGNQWKVHFNPEATGSWDFEVSFQKGKGLAVLDLDQVGEKLELDGLQGSFEVLPSDKQGPDFRGRGRIVVGDGGTHFKFLHSDNYFLKGGADSPENFLAYHEFDSTYRHDSAARSGEADPTAKLHQYAGHEKDWNTGDPTWKDGKGKGIIGALNYLATQKMNCVYFLTMNIQGDGKDVWPYTDHLVRDRFDCSKLDQWEMVFEHMEQLGIMMHVVTQETENEKLLDDGDTGPQRKLYYRELIARFGHHNALVWNLGEENGPANFSPNGQDTEQQQAMATNLKAMDPYDHPVLIHTHAWKGQKDELLPALLGHKPLDGLSFQVDHKEQVHDELLNWSQLAKNADHPWLITMDEIGMWHTGVMPDSVNPNHDTIRHQVLWGSLMAGAAGVEWYFGARYAHNDLTCEDWRSRENIWKQTSNALTFFEENLQYWTLQNQNELLTEKGPYCAMDSKGTYAVYFPIGSKTANSIDLGSHKGQYRVRWFNPKEGYFIQTDSLMTLTGPGKQSLSPSNNELDWVALLTPLED